MHPRYKTGGWIGLRKRNKDQGLGWQAISKNYMNG